MESDPILCLPHFTLAGVAILVLFLTSGDTPSSAGQKCVLPVADYQEETASPFNFEGVVARIHGNEIRVRLRAKQPRNASIITTQLSKKSQIFTVYGGYVDRAELIVGQRVRIWLEDCGQGNASARRLIAVMQLASTNPGDEFPR